MQVPAHIAHYAWQLANLKWVSLTKDNSTKEERVAALNARNAITQAQKKWRDENITPIILSKMEQGMAVVQRAKEQGYEISDNFTDCQNIWLHGSMYEWVYLYSDNSRSRIILDGATIHLVFAF